MRTQTVAIAVALLAGCDEKHPPATATPSTAPAGTAPATGGGVQPAAAPLPLFFTIKTKNILQHEKEALGVRSEEFIYGGVTRWFPVAMESPYTTLPLEITSAAGYTVQIGSTKAVADAKGMVQIAIDFGPEVKKAVAATLIEGEHKLFTMGWIKLPTHVVASDGGRREGTIDLDGPKAFVLWLQGLSHGPLLLDGETAAASGRRSAMVVLSTSTDILGDPKTFADVDLVALETWKLREKKCGPYVDDKGGNETFVPLEMWDTVVRLWDRRAGKELGKREFLAKATCPKTIHAKSTHESNDVAKEPIIKWVATFLKK